MNKAWVRLGITYDIVTEESALEGDTAENGYVLWWSGAHDAQPEHSTPEWHAWVHFEHAPLCAAREAVKVVSRWVCPVDSGVRLCRDGQGAAFVSLRGMTEHWEHGSDLDGVATYQAHITGDVRVVRAILRHLGIEFSEG